MSDPKTKTRSGQAYVDRFVELTGTFLKTEPDPPEQPLEGGGGAAAASKTAAKRSLQYNDSKSRQSAA